MKTTPRKVRDFAGLNDRFRPRQSTPPRMRYSTTNSFVYRPESVRNTGRFFNHRMQSWLRRSMPRTIAYVIGTVLGGARRLCQHGVGGVDPAWRNG